MGRGRDARIALPAGLHDPHTMKSLTLRLFGPVEILLNGTPLPTLRTHKGRWLLALLALRDGAAVERAWLAETLWPDSFDFKALYNLRRCLTDLRDALGDEACRLVSPSQRTLRLDLDGAEVDVLEFDRLIRAAAARGAGTDEEACLERAVALCRGPLFEGWSEDWAEAERSRRREAMLTALESLAARAAARGEHAAAAAHLRRVVGLCPEREAAQRALLSALAAAGDSAAMTAAYRALRLHLRDRLAVEPARETRTLYQHLCARAEMPPTGPDPASLAESHAPPFPSARSNAAVLDKNIPAPEPTGGALPPDSRFYVERAADEQIAHALRRGDGLVLVKGPRLIGKTSLLARAGARARAEGRRRVAVTDLSALGAGPLRSAAALLDALGWNLARQIGATPPPPDPGAPAGDALERFLITHALRPDLPPLVWMLDEVDVLFEATFRDEAFALFRSWYNARALDPSGAWLRLTLVFSYATEAHLFIADLNQSPFNVGTRLTLSDFTPEQVADLGRRHGADLPDADAARLAALLGGHPYLTQRALAALSAREADMAALEGMAGRDDDTLFSGHLRHIYASLLRDEALSGAMACLLHPGDLSGGTSMNPDAFHRLRSAGVLAGATAAEARCRCLLYDAYLRRRLPAPPRPREEGCTER
jgi:DNA-binding SARP family transcriptional activator